MTDQKEIILHQSDLRTQTPALSFAHLDNCLAPESDGSSFYGFAQPQEEVLYQTGVLSRIFLKC